MSLPLSPSFLIWLLSFWSKLLTRMNHNESATTPRGRITTKEANESGKSWKEIKHSSRPYASNIFFAIYTSLYTMYDIKFFFKSSGVNCQNTYKVWEFSILMIKLSTVHRSPQILTKNFSWNMLYISIYHPLIILIIFYFRLNITA